MPRIAAVIRSLTVAAASTAMVSTVGIVSPTAAGAPSPPQPAAGAVAIEAPAPYVRQNSCSLTAQPGTLKLAALLRRSYPSIYSGMTRVCSTAGSEHHDGRAIDWMVSIRNRKQRAYASAVLRWMLATDSAGNRTAVARRLGVMYLIWNNKIYSPHSPQLGWRAYRDCAKRSARKWDGLCHRNHIHISLSWAGAKANTSYWTRRVAATDYGPCRPSDLNWARYFADKPPRTTPCPRYRSVRAPRGASTTLKALVPYSGMDMRRGSRGNGVRALQRALRIERDGTFGSQTEAAVKRFQRKHKIAATGRVGHKVWRALLRENWPATSAARVHVERGPFDLGPDGLPDEGDA